MRGQTMADVEYASRGDKIVADDPVVVSRYRGITRLNHWVTAICMIILLLSGFALFSPYLYFLTGLFGGGQMARWLHPVVGVAVFISFLLLFLQMWKLNLPRPEDITWTLHIRDMLNGHEDRLPELGKYNAGQKMVFWGMSVLIIMLATTGIMIWQEYFPNLVTIPTRRIAVAIHALSAVGVALIFIAHVYAAIWTRGTIRAMTHGTVSGGWAWKHHRKWLRELAGRSKPEATK